MPTLIEGATAAITVVAGRTLTVQTDGKARVYRREGLSDAGKHAEQIVSGGERHFAGLNLDTDYVIDALSGSTEYTVAWPLIPSLPFRRNDAGAIDAVMDGDTAITLAADSGPAVTWDTLTGKPTAFAPIIGTTATTAMAGNTAIPAAATWANISGKPAVVAAGADAAAARASIGAGVPYTYTLPAAGAALGGVRQGAAVADAVDETDVVAQLNALLASLRTAGVVS